MTKQVNKIEIFFSKMFSTIILKNEIVSTILYNIMLQISDFDIKIKNRINKDI
jgi:hypothetical protein